MARKRGQLYLLGMYWAAMIRKPTAGSKKERFYPLVTRIQRYIAASTGSRMSAPKPDFLSLVLQSTRWLLQSQPSYLHFEQEEGRSMVEGRGGSIFIKSTNVVPRRPPARTCFNSWARTVVA